MKRQNTVISVAALLALAGCGGSSDLANVTGTVLVDGELASRGAVTFYPADAGAPATGRVREDGSFSLRVGQGNTSNVDASQIPAGEYRVTVVVYGPPQPNEVEGAPPGAGPRLMDARYGSVDTTDLIEKVKPGENLFNFDLEPAIPESDGEQAEDNPTSGEGEAAGEEKPDEAPTDEQGGSL